MAKSKMSDTFGFLGDSFGNGRRRKAKGHGLLAKAGNFGRKRKGRRKSQSPMVGAFDNLYKKTKQRKARGGFMGLASSFAGQMRRTEDHRNHDRGRDRHAVFSGLAHIQDRGERWAKYSGMKQDFSQGFREWVQDSLVEYESDDVQQIIKDLPAMAHDERWDAFRRIRQEGLNGRKLPTGVVEYIQDEIIAIEHSAQQGKGGFFQRMWNRMRYGRND